MKSPVKRLRLKEMRRVAGDGSASSRSNAVAAAAPREEWHVTGCRLWLFVDCVFDVRQRGNDLSESKPAIGCGPAIRPKGGAPCITGSALCFSSC